MINIKPTHFYRCNEYYLLVYPSKEKTLAAEAIAMTRDPIRAVRYSKILSKDLNCRVSYHEKDSPFLVLKNENNQYIKVLTKNNIGWIVYEDWFNLKEVK